MPGAQSQRQRLSPISSAADGRNWSTAARPPPRQGDFRCPSSMAERSGLCPDWRRSLLGKGTGLLCSRVGDGGRPFRLQCAKSAACAISGFPAPGFEFPARDQIRLSNSLQDCVGNSAKRPCNISALAIHLSPDPDSKEFRTRDWFAADWLVSQAYRFFRERLRSHGKVRHLRGLRVGIRSRSPGRGRDCEGTPAPRRPPARSRRRTAR